MERKDNKGQRLTPESEYTRISFDSLTSHVSSITLYHPNQPFLFFFLLLQERHSQSIKERQKIPTHPSPNPNPGSIHINPLRHLPRRRDLILCLPMPQIIPHRVPQIPTSKPRPTTVEHDDNVPLGGGEIRMPIPFKSVRHHLGAGSAVDADQDGVFFAAGDVEVGRKDLEHV